MAQLGLEQADSPWSRVFNNAVTDIPGGVAVVLDTAGVGGTGADTWVRLPTDAETGLVPYGLTFLPIKAKQWGNVTQRPGMKVPCVAGAALATKGVYVKASSVAGQNGRIIAAADGDAYVGVLHSVSAAAGDIVLVEYNKGANA